MKIENIDIHNYPNSEKVYISGELHPIKVAMRRVNLTPTVKIVDGERIVTENEPVYIYDTSGVFTDSNVIVDINNGIPRIRENGLQSVMTWSNCPQLRANMEKCEKANPPSTK